MGRNYRVLEKVVYYHASQNPGVTNYYSGDNDKMSGACSMHRRKDECLQGCDRENMKVKRHI